MSDGIRIPRFQLEKVYDDGSREEPMLHSLTDIDATCRMGRRGFLLTSAVGLGALATFSAGCATGSAQSRSNGLAFAPSARPDAPGYSSSVPRINAPKVHGLAAHRRTVHSIVFRPDSKTLFTAASDDEVKLWSIPEGKLQKTLEGAKLVSVALGADGKTLVTGHFNSTLRLWRDPFDTRAEKEIVNSGYEIRDVAFSPDGATMAVSTQKGVVLRSFPSGDELATLAQGQNVLQAVFSPDGAMLAASIVSTSEILLWSAPSWNLLARWNFAAERLAFSADGTLLGATDRGVLQLRRVSSGDVGMMLDTGRQQYAPLAFSPDGKWLAVRGGGRGGSGILLLPAPFSSGPAVLMDGHEGRVFTVAFSRDSRFLAAGTTAGAVYVWEMTGKEMPCVLKAVLCDASSTPSNVSARQAITSEKSVFIGRCGDPLPPGAICTCNCVAGRAPVGGTICSCNTVVTCTCNLVTVRSPAPSGRTGGGHCRCNRICTCVPIK